MLIAISRLSHRARARLARRAGGIAAHVDPATGRPAAPIIPEARPRRRRVAAPAVAVDPHDDPADLSPAWDWRGWAWSLGAHGLLLLVLGLWVFSSPRSEVRTFDTRLEGSDQGVDAGLTPLGGLDTPIVLPDAVRPPTETASTERMAPIDLAPQPTAGLAATNPGAGMGDGFGLAKFGSGGESVRGVEVRVGDPQFTLLWDTAVDLDLYVTEPDGKTIWWNDKHGIQGGELDVDNTDGFGPENIYWLRQKPDGSKELGPGPAGEYHWSVRYYGGNNGIPLPTRWKVRNQARRPRRGVQRPPQLAARALEDLHASGRRAGRRAVGGRRGDARPLSGSGWRRESNPHAATRADWGLRLGGEPWPPHRRRRGGLRTSHPGSGS